MATKCSSCQHEDRSGAKFCGSRAGAEWRGPIDAFHALCLSEMGERAGLARLRGDTDGIVRDLAEARQRLVGAAHEQIWRRLNVPFAIAKRDYPPKRLNRSPSYLNHG